MTTVPPTHAPPPPAPPAEPPSFDVDQGPMRSELLRQIAQLEADHAVLLARRRDWSMRRVTARRGPALLDTAALEQVRDELLTAIHDLHHGQARP
ncbi:hypothetical protein [Conexibacter sp. SYSU D00693]|uniref:hypothetical protein n=1 Tax=Conexibacter sp. SYSU D00693 TaxID=2812560 RepID=UPI00196A89DA|nr:hypothetical protein [Conexibacter sp. SYSU D00693]